MSNVLIEQIVKETCCNCGIVFGMSESFKELKLKNGESFYCPNGHGQHYTNKETKEEKLIAEVKRLKESRDFYENENRKNRDRYELQRRKTASQKGQRTKMMNRIKAGLCPCCNRTFSNLQEHMQNQHPDFSQEKE